MGQLYQWEKVKFEPFHKQNHDKSDDWTLYEKEKGFIQNIILTVGLATLPITSIIYSYRPEEMNDDDKFRMKKKAAGALLKVFVTII